MIERGRRKKSEAPMNEDLLQMRENYREIPAKVKRGDWRQKFVMLKTR